MRRTEEIKNYKGITLIALVVTIVVLLILAGVSISMLTGESGIITQAQKAKLENRGGEVEEQVNLWKNEHKLNEYSEVNVKTESELINELKTKGLVLEEEIDEENKKITIGEREIYYGLKESDPTALKFLVNSGDDGIVVLPINDYFCDSVGGYQIDWGDGTTGKDNTSLGQIQTKVATTKKIYISEVHGISHTYLEKNKEYIITISGKCEEIYMSYDVTEEKIIEILQWGETGLTKIDLKGCINLRKIASPSENSFINVTGFYTTFYGCTSLTEIPEDLFASCPDVTSFYETFENCTNLVEIPEDLFANCLNVTEFWDTFLGCTSLIKIPQDLFSNCTKVAEFKETFADCTALTGNAPELWTRGTNNEENDYQGEPDGRSCFYNCSGLTNYDIIPEYWKESVK